MPDNLCQIFSNSVCSPCPLELLPLFPFFAFITEINYSAYYNCLPKWLVGFKHTASLNTLVSLSEVIKTVLRLHFFFRSCIDVRVSRACCPKWWSQLWMFAYFAACCLMNSEMFKCEPKVRTLCHSWPLVTYLFWALLPHNSHKSSPAIDRSPALLWAAISAFYDLYISLSFFLSLPLRRLSSIYILPPPSHISRVLTGTVSNSYKCFTIQNQK